MNPHIKKDFILKAWNYNESLDTKFFVSYDSPTGYYSLECFKFEQKQPNNFKPITEKFYQSKTEELISNEISKNNFKKLKILGDDFLTQYFKHYFINHPENQFMLLKFFNEFFYHTLKPIQFIEQFEKKDIENFLINSHKWLDFNEFNLIKTHELMSNKNFNEGLTVSILKKFVENNLKYINKNPIISKQLEDFLFEKYPHHINIIAPNVVAIQSRKNDVQETSFNNVFSDKYSICFSDEIDIEKCLKTFQIAGWNVTAYSSLIKVFHDYLKTSHECSVSCFFSQNNKNAEFFIKTNNENINIDFYKKHLFILLNFSRNNPDMSLSNLNINKIFLHEKLNKNLESETHNTKTKSKI